jgi:hypothetical protein
MHGTAYVLAAECEIMQKGKDLWEVDIEKILVYIEVRFHFFMNTNSRFLGVPVR